MNGSGVISETSDLDPISPPASPHRNWSVSPETVAREFIGASTIVFLLLISFNKVFLVGDRFWLTDISNLTSPFHHALSSAITTKSFDSLIWNPNLFCGFPLLAEGEGGFLYLPNILGFSFLDPLDANTFLTIFHFILAGLFTYALARYLGVSRLGGILAGIVYPLGGTFAGYVQWVQAVSTAAWFPLLLLTFEWGWRRQRMDSAIPLGIIWAMQLLGGHTQTAFFSFVGLAVYAGGRLITSDLSIRRFGLVISLLTVCATIGMGLAAAQVLPSLELSRQSMRGNVPSDFAMTGSITPAYLISLVYPLVFLNPAAGVDWDPYGNNVWIYTGVVPLVLVFMSLDKFRIRAWLPIGLMTVVAFALALGKCLPFYPMLRFVPGFDGFRFPSRFGLVFDLGVGLLAARGLDLIPLKRSKAFFVLPAISCWGIAALLFLYFLVVSGQQFSDASDMVRDIALKNAGNPALPKDLLTSWLISTADMRLPWVVSPLALLGSTGMVVILASFWKKFRGTMRYILLMLTAVDLLFFASLVWPVLAKVPNSVATQVPSVVQALPVEVKNNRTVTSYGFAPIEDRLRPNYLMNYDVPILQGFSPLSPTRFSIFFSTLMSIPGTPQFARLLGASGVGYAIYAPGVHNPSFPNPFVYQPLEEGAPPSPFNAPNFIPIWQGVDGTIYHNEQVLPRARAVYSVLEASDMDQASQLLLNPAFDPDKQVVVEGHSGLMGIPGDTVLPSVNIERDDPLNIELNVNMEYQGLLFLADLYYPAWHVWVDGKEEPIYPANLMFRGVFLQPGQHHLQFVFMSEPLRIGIYITFGTLVLIICWGIWQAFICGPLRHRKD